MPYRKRPDNNQKEIISELRKAGYEVVDYHALGRVLDLLVTRHENQFSTWVECKRRGGVLTPAEKKFWDSYYGNKIIAFDGEDAVSQVRALEERHKERTW